MGAPSKLQLALALDTNVILDLADGKDFAATILEFLQEQKATIKIPPTVMVELEYEIEHPSSPRRAERAEHAFGAMPKWGITPLTLPAARHGVVEEFSKSMQQAGILPYGEFHDGCILAEVAFGGMDFLLSSDTHLLSIDREKLNRLFKDKELPKVEVVCPRNLYGRLKRR